MKTIETITVTENQAQEARKMISWFSQNVWEKQNQGTVEFHAVLDERGLENVLSALSSLS